MVTATLKHVKDFHHWIRKSNGYYDIGMYASVVKSPKSNGYVGSCRSGNASLDDVLDIIHYDEEFNLTYRKTITQGEDPRTFIYNNKPYSLTWDPNHQEILTYKLVDILDEKVINLEIENVPPSPLRVLGKNWMTVVKDGELYIILTIDPEINILHCNINNGKCTWVTPFENVLRGLPISCNRGGSPLVYHDELDLYVGLGHRTTDAWNHKPYLYTLTSDLKTSYMGSDFVTGKNGVEDPISIYKDGKKIYCGICNWLVPNGGSVGLYEVIVE
tara:strand:- start:2968 stop:3786 length:819 start_codon:yes stop_codon:yes gene_type:complete